MLQKGVGWITSSSSGPTSAVVMVRASPRDSSPVAERAVAPAAGAGDVAEPAVAEAAAGSEVADPAVAESSAKPVAEPAIEERRVLGAFGEVRQLAGQPVGAVVRVRRRGGWRFGVIREDGLSQDDGAAGRD